MTFFAYTGVDLGMGREAVRSDTLSDRAFLLPVLLIRDKFIKSNFKEEY